MFMRKNVLMVSVLANIFSYQTVQKAA